MNRLNSSIQHNLLFINTRQLFSKIPLQFDYAAVMSPDKRIAPYNNNLLLAFVTCHWSDRSRSQFPPRYLVWVEEVLFGLVMEIEKLIQLYLQKYGMLPNNSGGLNSLLDLFTLVFPFRLLLPTPTSPLLLISKSSDLSGSESKVGFLSWFLVTTLSQSTCYGSPSDLL